MGARKEKLKLVILWFGTWKNAKSTYVPAWIKGNTTKYPLMESQSGRLMNTLSSFGENSLQADAKAFAELMSHIKKVDSKDRTVIMVQVQNETGILGSPRDYSALANKAFAEQVPSELMEYLNKNKSTLYPGLLKQWEANGFKMKGTWEEVFGKGEKYKGTEWKTNFGNYTEELFMAWNIAKYVGEVTRRGKGEYALPMFANAWIKQPRATNPGKYPSGGPLPHVLDVWRAAAPAIDILAVDIYAVDEFDWVCKEFTLSQNPLLIAETTTGPASSARAIYAYGKYDALCYSPFGLMETDFLIQLTPKMYH
jgi:regulator of sigma D